MPKSLPSRRSVTRRSRGSAALAMNVEDVFLTDGRLWLHPLLETGGKVLEVPCHHNLEAYLRIYIEAAGIDHDRDGPRFRSLNRDGSLSGRRLTKQRAWGMLRRRVRAAGISTDVCTHSFRAAGITAYLENPGARVSRWPSTWPARRTPRRPSSMTGVLSASRWMKSRGSGLEQTTTAMGERVGSVTVLCVFDQEDFWQASFAQSP
ncbi:MAG: tyrosine-type recombinase/integrase [Boseongicola sp.]|nr:tyrosine-type recombinase/integrase [Boseongicola sp.]